MTLTQDRADPGRSPSNMPRPETARPPVDSDLPPDDLLDADGLDIDALLPAAFDTGAARVLMGQDLVELLRAAEERIEARAEPSRRHSPKEEGSLIPIPDDVLALLSEPLEGDDDEGATGASLGSSPGTGAERFGTHDGGANMPTGVEEDLEQPLPRASDIPRETTLARAPTGAGRSDSVPSPEDSRAAGTRPGSEPPPRLDVPSRSSDRGFQREPSEVPLAPVERGSDRGVLPTDRSAASLDRHALDRGVPSATISMDRAMPSMDRQAQLAERAVASLDRHALDRGVPSATISMDRVMPSMDRQALRADRGGPLVEWGGQERPVPSLDLAAQMVDRAAFVDRVAETPRGAMSERSTGVDRASARTLEMRTIERIHVEPSQHTPKVIHVAKDGGSKGRAAQSELVPAVLGPGDAPHALGRCIANRVSGALLITSGDDQRRIVLHDGDVVTAGSSAPVESLVAFLAARGDIDRDLVPRLAGKLPTFGRHAGAALVANGHLGQEDLWPVLRAHAEWVIGRALLVESGTCELEPEPPARYKAEPSVFGGATGAEVFVDVVQRVVAPEGALARLGGLGARLAQGLRSALLSECARGADEEDAVRAAPGRTVHELFGDGPTERWSMLYALVCLGVLEALPAIVKEPQREESGADPLDEEALRQRVRARLALVEEGDYFALLGVARSATSYEIRRAYLELRRSLEPARVLTATTADLAGDLRLILEVIEEAYEILRDTHRRDRYRRAIEAGPPR